MALPTTGLLSLLDVNVELGNLSNSAISLGNADVRDLAKVASGTISFSNLHGKAKAIGGYTGSGALPPSTFQTNFNVRTYALANGWDGVTPINVTITIPADTVLGSTSTATAAFDSGTLPSGSTITLINNGLIYGRGGDGGKGATEFVNGHVGYPGGAGGPAVKTTVPLSISNYGTIAGGGGGGGGGAYWGTAGWGTTGGSGGGGGRGYGNSSGGAPGGGTQYASEARYGSGGTYTAAGSGGVSGYSAAGGNGGNLGQNGGGGAAKSPNLPGGGGAAGKATIGNASITWQVTGSVLGGLT